MELVCSPEPLEDWVSIAGRGDSPAQKPQTEAGSWAVPAADRALVLPTLQRG